MASAMAQRTSRCRALSFFSPFPFKLSQENSTARWSSRGVSGALFSSFVIRVVVVQVVKRLVLVLNAMLLQGVGPQLGTWCHLLSALSTMLAFIVSSKLSSNLAKNRDAVGHFGNLAGVCLNIAIWSRSMVTDPNTDFDYLTLADGFGGSYSTTEMGLLLASIPFIVKYTYRGTSVRYEELPLGSSDSLLRRVLELTNPKNGQVPVSGFVAAIVLIGEKIDGYEARGAIEPPEMATIFAQLGKLTAEEGTIGGGVVYSQPGIITLLLYITFFAYCVLLILSDLGPNNEWNSLWITAVLIMSNLGVYVLSVRYSNPFRVRTGNSTQRPLIRQTCREMEVAIAGVYSRRRRFDSYPMALGRSWRAPT